MTGFMSPADLDREPTRWLNIPHEMHETLLKLMDKMFPGFTKKLEELHIHCFQCEGDDDCPVVIANTMEEKICVGYIGEKTEPDSILLSLQDIKE